MEITRREGSQGKWMGTGEWRERWLEPSLGKRLGPSLGKRLGPSLGKTLGPSLGKRLGPSLGKRLGPSLGKRLGPSLGKRLGPSLGRGLQREFGSWLFTLSLLLLLLLPPVFPQCPDSCHCVWESSMVLCMDAGLHEFPQGLPLDTIILHLERNYIRSLPEGSFRELTHLRELYLSHNHINTLSSGALRHLSSELRLLDLSHNLLRQASRDEFGSTRAKTRLYNNPWHCDCTLQELMETLNLEPETVNGIMCESSVRSSGEGSRWEDPGGASEHSGQPLVKLLNSGVNFCSLQRKTTDVAMLVTMFVWFFMVIVYVVYYVRQNQAETRRHLEYLKSLPSPRKTLTETDTISTGL